MNIWTLVVLFIFDWEIIRFIDWAGIIIFGDLPRSHLEGLFAFFMQLLWAGLLGIIFAYLIPQITSRGYMLKGAIFGILAGFIIYAIPTLFQIPFLKDHSLATATANHLGGLIWGLTTARTLYWLDKAIVK